MRIAIITTPFQNYGSRLQNLATIELLNEQYPNSIIHTLIPSRTNNKFLLLFKNSFLLKFIFLKMKFRGKINKNNNLLKYRIFFIKNFSVDELKFLDKEYDLFVVGSDQIWNYPNGEKSNFLFAMFTNKKVCNAPSFAITKYTTTPEMKQLLSSFKDLNVRESEVSDYINKQLNIKCYHLLDPTIRLSLQKWNLFVKKSKTEDHVLIYILENKNLLDEVAEAISKTKQKKIVIFNSNDGKNVFRFTPIEFVNIVAHASCVITNSFHGACLAKVFNKKLKIYKNNKPNDARFNFFINYNNLIEIV